MIYRAIGKAVVKYAAGYVGLRYGRAIRIGAGVFAVGVGVALYIASRNVPEG